MSMGLMVRAMEIRVGNPLRKLVLLKLADNASDQGECWPSYQHIADQCEISKRSVMSHIDALCQSGLLSKEIRKGPKGNSSNVYRLHITKSSEPQKVVQEIHQGGAGDSLVGSAAISLSGATDSPGGSAGAAPRISHSFEPVNEPENISCPDASLSDESELSPVEKFMKKHPEAVTWNVCKRQWGSQDDLTCAEWIWRRILRLYELATTDDSESVLPKTPNWTVWANDVRLMRMQDGRSHKQICEMFKRVQNDPFWFKNVRCPSKLREKWDDLIIHLSTAGQYSTPGRDINRVSQPDNTIPDGFRG
ncbi:helix-turn-helix domain-containing protein [Klebsiella aerogenes]